MIVDDLGVPVIVPALDENCKVRDDPEGLERCRHFYRKLAKRAHEQGTMVTGCCKACEMLVAAVPMQADGFAYGCWLCAEFINDSNRTLEVFAKDPKLAGLNVLLSELGKLSLSKLAPVLGELDLSEPISRTPLSLQGIFNAVDDPMFVKDKNHRWVLVNNAFCQLVGMSRKQLIGRTDADVFASDQAEAISRKETDVFCAGVATTTTDMVTVPSGHVYVVSTKRSLFQTIEGQRYLVGVIRDVTDQVRTHKRLLAQRRRLENLVKKRTQMLSRANTRLRRETIGRRKAEADKREMQELMLHQHKVEALGRLAGGIAHDFNNMLTGILGHASLAMRDESINSRSRELIQQVLDAAQRTTSLTKQLLAFSRKQVIEPRVVNLNELVKSIEALLKRIITEDITLITNCTCEYAEVLVDPAQIEQVIVNLAVNARDAMPDGGTLRIETQSRVVEKSSPAAPDDLEPGNYVVLVVSDTGVGMDEDVMSKIYDPFFTSKPKGMGTGLGLSTAYGIVKQHRGSIKAHSKIHQGTTFEVLLPRYFGEDKSVPVSSIVGEYPTGNECILLVEDEHIVRMASQGILERLGYHVIGVANPLEAITTSDMFEGTIDLLLTDVVMPQMNGRELADCLRMRRPNLQVLFTSGYTDEVVLRRGVHGERVNFIAKPFDSYALASAVRLALKRGKPHTAH